MRGNINKFYFLSILCLLPVFGTILGVILIFYTFSKFQNKTLFIILLTTTLGGVVIGYIDYSNLRNELMYGEEAGNILSEFAADDLDRIAKKLEIYKSEHGSFPDSLAQLQKENHGLLIKDRL